MSGNPAIFDAARVQAYGWTRAHGLCRSGAAGFGRALPAIRELVQRADAALPYAERELPSALEASARSIAAFCVNRLSPSGRRPHDPVAAAARRTARGATRRMTDRDSLLYGGRPTVRRIAAIQGRAPATVQRDLTSRGDTPRRSLRIAAMRPLDRRVAALLEMLCPTCGSQAVVRTDELVRRVYTSEWEADSTPRVRRRRLRASLARIASAGIGLHPVTSRRGGLVATRRGRRWHGFGEVAEVMELTPPRPVPALPKARLDPVAEAAREAAEDVHAMLCLAIGRQRGEALWRLGQRAAGVLDLHPLRRLAEVVERVPADETLQYIARRLREGSGLDFRALARCLAASDALAAYGRFSRNAGWDVACWLDDSGYTERARAGGEAGCLRLAMVRGMCAALLHIAPSAALEIVARWRCGEDLPEPIEASQGEQALPLDEDENEAESVEIMRRYAIARKAVSHPAYHKRSSSRPRPPIRPPSGPPGPRRVPAPAFLDLS